MSMGRVIDLPPFGASGGGSGSYLDTVAAIDGAIYWTFDEASGTTAKAYDSGGENSSYDGTYSGAYTYQTTEFPKTGLSVATNPGSNAYVDLDVAAMDTLMGAWRKFTYAVWWRPTSTATINPLFARFNQLSNDHVILMYKNASVQTFGLTLRNSNIGPSGSGAYTVNDWNFSYFSFQDNTESGGGKWYYRINDTTNSGTHAITSNTTGFNLFRLGAAINLATTLAGQVGLFVVIPSYSESNDSIIYDGGIA